MEFKQSNSEEILESKRKMVTLGAERFGDYFINAFEFNDLLQRFIKSVDPDRFIFAMFLSQIRKHHTLALFSTVRLHHIQAMMDIRQVLEAGTCAAYAMANPDRSGFAGVDENGILDPSQSLSGIRYKWLEDNFRDKSDFIKNMKDSINKSTAHSNIVYAHNNFRFDGEQGRFQTPFFDIENDYMIKTDLWLIGNIAMSIMDLFYGVNKNLNVVKFADDFIPQLKKNEAVNHQLKAEMMKTKQFQRADRRASQANKEAQPKTLEINVHETIKVRDNFERKSFIGSAKKFQGEAQAGRQKGRGGWGEFRRVLAKDRGQSRHLAIHCKTPQKNTLFIRRKRNPARAT